LAGAGVLFLFLAFRRESPKTSEKNNGLVELRQNEIEVANNNVPRDRNGELDPVIVKKQQKSVTGIEDQIIAMYAKGISTWDIQDHLQNLYGVDVSPTMISNVTNKIVPIIKERQNRPLLRVYDLPRPNRLASAIKECSPLRGRCT